MRMTHIIGVLLITVLLLGACAPAPAPATVPTPTPAPAPKPESAAQFEVVSLHVTPTQVTAGETVTVKAEVKNIGGSEGVYTAILTVNGVEVETKDIVVAPGATETVAFSLVKDKTGTYNIELGSLTGTLSVSPIPVPIYYSNPQTYRVIRTFTIQNETARIDRLGVWMPAVVDWDSQRNVVTEETTPPTSSVWNDPQSGTGVLYWEFHDNPGRGSSITITDQFTYTCYEVGYVVDLEQITAYDKDDPEYILFTRSEKYIEANDPEIIETARSLAGDETNPYAIANSIYEWVIDHMTYQLIEGLGGAKFAFRNGYGECGDYSALFTALCRAAGIPARPIIGRWATSIASDWHVWAEFYLPGYGWLPVDATVADSRGKREDYFGRLDNKRLIFNKQYNIILHPRPNFIASKWALLQTYVWEYQGLQGRVQAGVDYSIKPIASD